MNSGDIYDLFAGVLRAALLVALVGSAWLVNHSRDDKRRRPEWIDVIIVLALMGFMWALIDIGNDRISLTSLMVVALAFNLGRWRGAHSVPDHRLVPAPSQST